MSSFSVKLFLFQINRKFHLELFGVSEIFRYGENYMDKMGGGYR